MSKRHTLQRVNKDSLDDYVVVGVGLQSVGNGSFGMVDKGLRLGATHYYSDCKSFSDIWTPSVEIPRTGDFPPKINYEKLERERLYPVVYLKRRD